MDQAIIGFVGVVVGAVLTGVMNFLLQRSADKSRWEHERQRWDREDKRREEEEKSTLAQRHLFQFQEAVEALWHRLKNLEVQGGRYVMSKGYFETTTMYALGRVLAVERMLALQGVYPRLYDAHPELGNLLRERPIERGLEGIDFYQYDRISLAEAVIEAEEGEHFRISTYLEFRRRYEAEGSREREWLQPSKKAIERLSAQQMAVLRDSLRKMALLVAKSTGVPSTLEKEG